MRLISVVGIIYPLPHDCTILAIDWGDVSKAQIKSRCNGLDSSTNLPFLMWDRGFLWFLLSAIVVCSDWGCSDDCEENGDGTATCSCPDFHELDDDQKTCIRMYQHVDLLVLES